MAGISAGATVSDIEGGAFNAEPLWGFTGGLFGAVRASQNLVFELEVNYVQKGGAEGPDVRLGYIEVPLLFDALLPLQDDRIHFNLFTGIAFGIRVSCSERSELVLLSCDDARSTEWSWPLGLALGFKSANGNMIGIDVRTSFGLSDTFSTSTARNRSLQFRLFYGVPLR